MPERMRILGLEEHVALPLVLDVWSRVGVPQTPQLSYGDEPFAQRLRTPPPPIGSGRRHCAYFVSDQNFHASESSRNERSIR